MFVSNPQNEERMDPSIAKHYKNISYRSISSIPEFVLLPPQEEHKSEPCLVWIPDERVSGLPNPVKDPQRSLFNALVQLFGNLAALHDELPLLAKSELVSLFTKACHGLQRNRKYPSIITIPSYPIKLPDSDEKNLYHDTRQNIVYSDVSMEDPISKLLLKLHSIINSHPYKTESFDSILDFGPSYTLIMQEIILNTRFGQRFLSPTPTFSDSLPCAVPLSLSNLEGREKVDMMPLLNASFGLPSLFFGGQPIPKRKTLLPLFKALPHYLVFLIQRKDPITKRHSSITLSFSVEMDMGKFLEEGASKPAVSHGYSGSPTFYRLHGFVTQKDGIYMTYTRTQSGSKWWKIEDEDVTEAEMASNIESKGVSCLIYRLQDF